MATVSQTQHQAAGTESTTDASVSGQAGLTEEKLTFDHQVLTSFLVPLASATDLVSKAITLMAKGVAVLTHGIVHHLLALQRSIRNGREHTFNLLP